MRWPTIYLKLIFKYWGIHVSEIFTVKRVLGCRDFVSDIQQAALCSDKATIDSKCAERVAKLFVHCARLLQHGLEHLGLLTIGTLAVR